MFSFFLSQYYAESHAVIYIVDSSDRDRISESKETFGKFLTCFFLVKIFILLLLFLKFMFTSYASQLLFWFSDKMISSQSLQGVPLLVLANKQDITDCMGVREVKPIFNQNAHLIGRRDCMVMPISALTGFVSNQFHYSKSYLWIFCVWQH